MNKPIRVLHILQRMEAGGTQALLMNLYRNIDRTKVQFDFLVEYPNKQFYDDEIKELGGKIFYSSVRIDFNILKFEKQLEKILKENNYKIVHVHAYTIGFFCLKVAKKCGIKVRIAHSHNNETVRDIKYFPKLILQKLYMIHATDLFACSEEAGKYLFKNNKFQVLKNAIDTDKFRYSIQKREKIRRELKITDEFVIGNVGRLHPQKNQEFLIDIFKKIKESNSKIKLLLVGSGPLENKIKQYIKKLNISENVIMLKDRNDMDYIYNAMDVFVLPSLFEGLGIVAIEAQAAGLPVFCSDSVSKEVEITKKCYKISLSESPKIWADRISCLNYLDRNIDKDEFIKSGYDIQNVSEKMQMYYINKYYN